jgi:hypothetical protein
MTADDAELLAVRALGWLAGNDELWPAFLGTTGASVDSLRTAAADPAFLISVLDFLTQADASVIACRDAERVPYEAPLLARRALPGGAEKSWT